MNITDQLHIELNDFIDGKPRELLHIVNDKWMETVSSTGASPETLALLPSLSPSAAAYLALSLGVLVEQGGRLQAQLEAVVALFKSWTQRLLNGVDLDVEAYNMVAQSCVAHVARSDAQRRTLAYDTHLLGQLEALEDEHIAGACWVRQLLRGRRGRLVVVDVDGESGVELKFENIATIAELIVQLQRRLRDAQMWRSHPAAGIDDRYTAWGHYTLSSRAKLSDTVVSEASPDTLRVVDGKAVLYLHRNQHGALRWNEWDMGVELEAAPVSVDVVGVIDDDLLIALLPSSDASASEAKPVFDLDSSDADTRLLQKLLDDKGADCAPGEGWLHGAEGVSLSASVTPRFDGEGVQTSVVLDVGICFPDDRVVFECFAGWGGGPSAQRLDAFDNFAHNALDVLVEAYGGAVTDGPVNVFDVVDGEATWRLVVGGVGMRTSGDAYIDVPPDMVRAFVEAIQTTAKPAAHHAFRVFFAFAGGECLATEALMDGVQWEEGLEAMLEVDWPHPAAYTSFRIFAVAHTDAARDVEPTPSSQETVALVVDGCLAQASDEAIYSKLRGRGVGVRDAELAIALVPMAFARAQMPGATWPQRMLVDGDEGRSSVRLAGHALYDAALAQARAIEDDDAVRSVARRSAEWAVAMKLMDGAFDVDKTDGFVFSDPIVNVDRLVPSLRRRRGRWVRASRG